MGDRKHPVDAVDDAGLAHDAIGALRDQSGEQFAFAQIAAEGDLPLREAGYDGTIVAKDRNRTVLPRSELLEQIFKRSQPDDAAYDAAKRTVARRQPFGQAQLPGARDDALKRRRNIHGIARGVAQCIQIILAMQIGDRAQMIGIRILDLAVAVDDVEAVEKRSLDDAVEHHRANVLIGRGRFQGRARAEPIFLQTIDNFRDDRGDRLQRPIGFVGDDVGKIFCAAATFLDLKLVEIDVERNHTAHDETYHDDRADEEGGLPAHEPEKPTRPAQDPTQERTHS